VFVLDETHDPRLQSWVESANAAGCDFPIQNLPLGVVRGGGRAFIASAIGDRVVDMGACVGRGLLNSLPDEARVALCAEALNGFMAGGVAWRIGLRRRLSELLRTGSTDREAVPLLAARDVVPTLPAVIGDYTDFYASIHHATNVGRLFRPDNPLMPNYRWMPVAYHGRSSSIVPSPCEVVRPRGQIRTGEAPPQFAPTRMLDYEVEMGLYVAEGNALGRPVSTRGAEDRVFGLCVLNDWSARDIQAWEYQPLGPFLGKSFCTTVSPWIITAEALAPFRTALRRDAGEPAPLPYLMPPGDTFDITVEAWLKSTRLSRASFASLYWTPAQMIAHHASNGCNLRPGDLLGSGTISGPTAAERGCLLELTRRGAEPLSLPGGESRTFLQDGDEVILRAYCERDGFRTIGFGECRGVVRPAYS
jgi:fumarylacetoacetase